jgi:hypothetical protein
MENENIRYFIWLINLAISYYLLKEYFLIPFIFYFIYRIYQKTTNYFEEEELILRENKRFETEESIKRAQRSTIRGSRAQRDIKIIRDRFDFEARVRRRKYFESLFIL